MNDQNKFSFAQAYLLNFLKVVIFMMSNDIICREKTLNNNGQIV